MIKEGGRSRDLNLNSSSRHGRGRNGNRATACAAPGEATREEARLQDVRPWEEENAMQGLRG